MDWLRKSLLYVAVFGRELLMLLLGRWGISFGVKDGVFDDTFVGSLVDNIASSSVSGEPETLWILK